MEILDTQEWVGTWGGLPLGIPHVMKVYDEWKVGRTAEEEDNFRNLLDLVAEYVHVWQVAFQRILPNRRYIDLGKTFGFNDYHSNKQLRGLELEHVRGTTSRLKISTRDAVSALSIFLDDEIVRNLDSLCKSNFDDEFHVEAKRRIRVSVGRGVARIYDESPSAMKLIDKLLGPHWFDLEDKNHSGFFYEFLRTLFETDWVLGSPARFIAKRNHYDFTLNFCKLLGNIDRAPNSFVSGDVEDNSFGLLKYEPTIRALLNAFHFDNIGSGYFGSVHEIVSFDRYPTRTRYATEIREALFGDSIKFIGDYEAVKALLGWHSLNLYGVTDGWESRGGALWPVMTPELIRDFYRIALDEPLSESPTLSHSINPDETIATNLEAKDAFYHCNAGDFYQEIGFLLAKAFRVPLETTIRQPPSMCDAYLEKLHKYRGPFSLKGVPYDPYKDDARTDFNNYDFSEIAIPKLTLGTEHWVSNHPTACFSYLNTPETDKSLHIYQARLTKIATTGFPPTKYTTRWGVGAETTQEPRVWTGPEIVQLPDNAFPNGIDVEGIITKELAEEVAKNHGTDVAELLRQELESEAKNPEYPSEEPEEPYMVGDLYQFGDPNEPSYTGNEGCYHFKFVLGTTELEYHVAVGAVPNLTEYRKALRETFGKYKGTEATLGFVSVNYDTASLLVGLPLDVSHTTIYHEAMHLVAKALRIAGVELTRDTEEVYCYALPRVIENLRWAVKRARELAGGAKNG